MSDALEWLQNGGKSPTLVSPKVLQWDRGPINPETGTAHTYAISGFNTETNPEGPEATISELILYFQNGVLPEVGANGVTPQILLEVLIDRFEGFQKGPFKCEENDVALSGMRKALDAIKARMANREARGVANTMQK